MISRFALLFVLTASAAAQSPAPLETKVQTQLVFNGVAVTNSGRIFVPFQRQQPNMGIEVGEILGGSPRAYLDAGWNAWKTGGDPRHAFIGVNALRIGPDGALWIVDKGADKFGADTLPGGPKVVRIDLTTNRVTRVIDLSSVAVGKGFIDDIRFNGRHAYLTDAGRPGVIVLDLTTGHARRVLDGDPSTAAAKPLLAQGKQLTDPQGQPIVVHVDQLEVSPDGRWFYYQPCSGPMSRIETRFLDDSSISDSVLRSKVQRFADTGSTGGTAIDVAGNIYASDIDHSRILKIDPSGRITTFIQDSRLGWIDAMWIDDTGGLWLPSAQLNHTKGFNGGKDIVTYPTVIYRVAVGAKPVRR